MRPSFLLLTLGGCALLPLAAQARSADDIPGVSDEPALARYAEPQLSLGFADHSDARAAGKGGDGAVTFSEQTRDGRSLPLRIDPISGEVLGP